MNNEFKKTANKNQTVYTLESATAGGTSAGSIASVSSPMGGVQKRGGNLIAQESDKKVPATTPRNFVAKNAKTGGAGAHKDKKKAEKQGSAKHKKPYMEALQAQIDQLKSKVAEGVATTMPMPDAVKVLRQYGADHFKTTSNELHFYKNGRHLRVDLVMNPDTTRSVTLSSLNAATRGLKGQGVAEGIMNTIANKVMGAAPEQPKYKVGQRVKYETSPGQPEWKDGGRGVGVITAYKNGHYMINGNPVNHFEIKGVVEQGVAEGSEIKIPTEDGITMQDIRLMAGEGPLTKKTVLQAIAVIRKQRRPQGVAEGSDGWIGNPAKWKEAVLQAHGDDVVFKNYSHPGQPGKRSVNAINAAGKQVGVYQRHNKMGMVQPNMQGVAEGFNGEYDDEAGMAQSNLHTMARAVKGLMDTIDSNDNLPEWCQEKIAKAEMMVTGVWDYLLSQKEQGMDPEQGVAEGAVKGVMMDLKSMSDQEFMAKYKKTKAEARAAMKSVAEGAKVDRQAKHITASMMKKGKSKKDAESIAWAHIKHPKNESVDPYFESLNQMVERQLEPTMDLDVWNDNFQNADPQKYHQFKNKSPEKKK